MSQAVDIRSLLLSDAAELLGISEKRLRRHIRRGAPLTEDRKVDLILYGAWLNREVARRRRDADAEA